MKRLMKVLNGEWEFSHMFSITFVIRLISAQISPILDCDECFNYVEPLHYLLYGYGFQTWEYAPQFALRSWFFVLLYAIIGSPLSFLGFQKSTVFFAIRGFLAICSTAAESYFILAIQQKFGSTRASNVWILLTFSTGTFFASTAILRNSFSMHFIMLSFGSWLNDYTFFAIFFMGISGLLGEMTSIFTALAMGAHILYYKGWFKTFFGAFLSLGLILPVMILVDSYFYGQRSFTILNFAIYNSQVSGGSDGQNLYGVEPWYWYLVNLTLNFNLALPAAFGAMFLCPEVGVYFSIPFALVFCFFSFMPHKEERFFYLGFPILAALAASFFDIQGSRKRIISRFQKVGVIKKKVVHSTWHKWTHGARRWTSVFSPLLLLLFMVISVSRTAAVVSFYGGSFQIWQDLEQTLYNEPALLEVCVGSEWYRFHSHFFLPEGRKLRFLKSDFGGQLPALFDGDTTTTHGYFNDMNREEPSRYFEEQKCDVLVHKGDTVPKGWKRGGCMPFLNKEKTPLLARTLYVPYLKDRVVWTQICWLTKE